MANWRHYVLILPHWLNVPECSYGLKDRFGPLNLSLHPSDPLHVRVVCVLLDVVEPRQRPDRLPRDPLPRARLHEHLHHEHVTRRKLDHVSR